MPCALLCIYWHWTSSVIYYPVTQYHEIFLQVFEVSFRLDFPELRTRTELGCTVTNVQLRLALCGSDSLTPWIHGKKGKREMYFRNGMQTHASWGDIHLSAVPWVAAVEHITIWAAVNSTTASPRAALKGKKRHYDEEELFWCICKTAGLLLGLVGRDVFQCGSSMNSHGNRTEELNYTFMWISFLGRNWRLWWMGKVPGKGSTYIINTKPKELCIISNKFLNADCNSWGKSEFSSQATCQGYSVCL